MNPERWQCIEKLFFEALELESQERDVWLTEQCGMDEELRAEVERLLASDERASTVLLSAVAASVTALEDHSEPPETLTKRIGPYEVLAEIGRGGMGVVYRARRDDDVFRKQVAIKVVKRGMDTDQILARFRHERRILARLEHPYIARIIDGGSEGGAPYLVMEYVEGLPLTDYCARNELDLRSRLELFCKVCAAVEYAHRHLIVHRDLKPSNILVDRDGTPKLLDFGIAKLLAVEDGEKATLTVEDTYLLTPQYASPEQVAGEPITTASDIYSLGAILYELLTGSQPHRITSNTPVSLVRAICEEELRPASRSARESLNPPIDPAKLTGDLDNILMTAMCKDPHERYGSVHVFSEDLQRFVMDRPVLARSQTLRYRITKFLRRNRVYVIAASLAAIGLIAGTLVSIYQAHRAERRFQQVRTLANSFLFEIHDEIETLPGSTRARELMVRTALRYLNNLAVESSDDPSLQWELATAYQKIGDVQGYGLRPNLGQRMQAIESHSKALSIAEQLASRGYDPKVQRLLALAHDRMGFLILGDQTMVAAGQEHYRKARDLLEDLNRITPGDPETSRLLIVVYGHLGDEESLLGKTSEAAANWQRGLDVAQQWSTRHPGEAARLTLAMAHLRVSKAAQLRADLTDAAAHARAAIEINEQLLAAQPASTSRQRELLNSYERLSFVLGNPEMVSLGDLPTALEYNRKVVALASALSDADPSNIMAGSDLLIAKNFTCAYWPDEDAASIVRICQEALDTAVRHRREPIESLPLVATRLGPALAKLGRRGEAAKTMESAIELVSRSIASWPWRADIRLQLLRLHNQFGAVLLRAGSSDDARKQYQSGLAIGQALVRSRPDDPLVVRDLADSYRSLAQFYQQSDCTQSRQWREKELDIWAGWARRFPTTSMDRSRLNDATHHLIRCSEMPGNKL